MYAAIALVYSDVQWVVAIFIVLIAALLWKFYLSNLFNKTLWKQLAKA